MMDLDVSALDLLEYFSGGGSVEDFVARMLERVEKEDKAINAYITLNPMALDEARGVERRIRRGEIGRLMGIPIAIKDNISTKGIRTTCGSKMLESYIPPYDAEVVRRIRREGGILIGKTNMDEFAMGSSTEFSAFGPTRNPIDIDRVPGGSSGGSAACLRNMTSTLALGSDTGGSIRCPAAFTATVGLKPTYGRVSRYGLIAYANSLEQIGPMARSVGDLALLFEVIAGRDEKDSTSLDTPVDGHQKWLEKGIEGLRVGVVRELSGEGIDERVLKVFWRAVAEIEGMGIGLGEASIGYVDHALASYYIIAMSEASSNLARFDGIRYGLRLDDRGDWSSGFSRNRGAGFGQEVKRRIILGTFALSAGYYEEYYLKAQKVRRLVKDSFDRLFKEFDLLIAPTMPILPWRIGEKQDPLEIYMSDIATVPANLAGIPSLSIPIGFYGHLPVGLQIMAPAFGEPLALRLGRAIEEVLKP